MLAGIAWKNIWRNKKRSAVILTAIALGLCGGLIVLFLAVVCAVYPFLVIRKIRPADALRS